MRFAILRLPLLLASVTIPTFALTACTTAYRKSVGADRDLVLSRVFIADFNMTWQAVLDSLKSARLDISNRDAGLVQTRWSDNTSEKNFSDSDGGVLMYTKAQVRFRVSLLRGFNKGYPAVKVSVQKEQVIQRDALDDMHSQESDGIEEKTLMYRIGRILKIKLALQRAEEAKTQAELRNSEFNTGGGLGGAAPSSGLGDGVAAPGAEVPFDGGAGNSGGGEELPFEPASPSASGSGDAGGGSAEP